MRPALLALIISWFLASVAMADLTPRQIIALLGQQRVEVPAWIENREVWVRAEDLAKLTGFTFKPEGVCIEGQCLGIGAKVGPWFREQDGATLVLHRVVAERIDQAFAFDESEGILALGEPQVGRAPALSQGMAPDFELFDKNGKPVCLSDFRGKKVLVLAWASWCACSKDLPGWEQIYRELRDDGFEIIAAAQDTGGEQAAREFYDRAEASFTALVDPNHVVSTAFQMVNVPTGVWIDEVGTIVRPPEVAYSHRYKILGQEIGDDEYALAVRDWVKNGSESRYVMTSRQLEENLAIRSFDERRADAEFKLGVYFYQQGKKDLARMHCAEAQRLCPDNWNYHRQDWNFNGPEALTKWLQKVNQLNGRPYYEPVKFPEK